MMLTSEVSWYLGEDRAIYVRWKFLQKKWRRIATTVSDTKICTYLDDELRFVSYFSG